MSSLHNASLSEVKWLGIPCQTLGASPFFLLSVQSMKFHVMQDFIQCRNGKGCSRPSVLFPTLILHKIVCIQMLVKLSIGWYTIHMLLSLSKLYRSSRTPRLESPKNRAYHKRGFFFLSDPKVPPLFLLCGCYHFFCFLCISYKMH